MLYFYRKLAGNLGKARCRVGPLPLRLLLAYHRPNDLDGRRPLRLNFQIQSQLVCLLLQLSLFRLQLQLRLRLQLQLRRLDVLSLHKVAGCFKRHQIPEFYGRSTSP